MMYCRTRTSLHQELGKTQEKHDLHLWDLHEKHNQDVGHVVHLNSQDHRNLHLQRRRCQRPPKNCNCGTSAIRHCPTPNTCCYQQRACRQRVQKLQTTWETAQPAKQGTSTTVTSNRGNTVVRQTVGPHESASAQQQEICTTLSKKGNCGNSTVIFAVWTKAPEATTTGKTPDTGTAPVETPQTSSASATIEGNTHTGELGKHYGLDHGICRNDQDLVQELHL